jgi:hypothetical protein
MRIPGFTAEVGLSQVIKSYSSETNNRTIGGQTVTAQFVGGSHCHWECYPGAGCGYFCEFLPF